MMTSHIDKMGNKYTCGGKIGTKLNNQLLQLVLEF